MSQNKETKAKPKVRRPRHEAHEIESSTEPLPQLEPASRVESENGGEFPKSTLGSDDSISASEDLGKARDNRIQFEGSEVLRHRFPKSFELAEVLVSDWIHGGNFEGLPIPNPTAKLLALQTLKTAKHLEKSVLNSPLFEKLALQGMETAVQVQAKVEKWRKSLMGR